MTTFAQSTIHSKIAKLQKVNDSTMGHVVKGTVNNFGIRNLKNNSEDPEILREIEILPKNKLNLARKIKNKRIINGGNKREEIVLMQSSIFPAIYFKKTSMRNVLKEFQFPQNCQGLPSEDQRTPHIYQIISNLFNQITFHIFNILIGQNLITNSYFVFFSDSETLPFTKCCNAPVFIELIQNGSGKIMCNALNCQHPNLAQFLINFEDGQKLWKHVSYFYEASQKDKQLKKKISKLILNGRFKKRSLVNMVQDTSKQIVDIFYMSKNKNKINSEEMIIDSAYGQEDDEESNPFLTDNQTPEHVPITQYRPSSSSVNQQNEEQILIEEEKNIETLKMKLMYISKRQPDIDKKISQQIVEDSKIFHKDFNIVRRIDQLMLKNRNTKGTAKVSFPRLMSQVKRIQKSQRNRQKSLRQGDYSSIV